MTKNTYKIAWIFLLTASALLRLATAFYWNSYVESVASQNVSEPAQDGPFFFGDSDSYWKLGRALAFARPYQFDEIHRWQVFRTPGYPALLAPLFWIFRENPPVLAARLLGVCFGVVNVYLVGILACALFSGFESRKLIAVIAGACAAFDPTLVFQSVCVLSEEPFLTFALLLNLTIYRVARKFNLLPSPEYDLNEAPNAQPSVCRNAESKPTVKPTVADAIRLAALSTATIYLRPSSAYYLLFVALTLVALRFARKRRALPALPVVKRFLLFAVATALLHVLFLSPWIIRNYALTGRIITTSLQSGASLYDGLSPTATGASDMTFVDQFFQDELNSPSDDENILFEVRLDERLKKAALTWAKAHPLQTLKLAAIKFYRLWAPIPREKAFSRPLFMIVLACSFTPVFLLGLCGAIRSLNRNGAAWFLAILPLYTTCLHVIFVSSIRYRVPCMASFDILAAFFLVSLWQSREAKSKS